MRPRVAVVLCGSGRFDGSEIHESVLSLFHLEKGGASWQAFAPDAPQWAVCEHFGGEAQPGETRNQLQEAARITRGRVRPLAEARAADFDALLMPGGSGAARNLCDFAERGADGRLIPELEALIRGFHAAGKPIGALCIAPALVALALGPQAGGPGGAKGGPPIHLTLGPVDRAPATEVARTGVRLQACAVDEICVDRTHRIVSTPAYVLGPDLVSVEAGIGKCVAALLALCGQTAEAR